MPSLIFSIFLTLIPAYIINYAFALYKNIQKAKASGIPYVVVPFYTYNILYTLFGSRLLVRTDKYLSAPKPTSWRFLCRATWPWRVRYEPFRLLGTDTFITVAPGGLIFYTADPAVITQITTRRTDFPKPTWLYRTVSIYGANIVSSEGEVWRRHRKMTSSAFGEGNNKLVWSETIRVTLRLLEGWKAKKNGKVENVTSLLGDTMRLSLDVFGKAGFGRQLDVPGTEENQALHDEDGTTGLENGHEMTFVESLEVVLKKIFLIMVFPKWLLPRIPSKMTKRAYLAYKEWGEYMRQLVALKKVDDHEHQQQSPKENTTRAQLDLLSLLIKGAEDETQKNGEKDSKNMPGLSDSELMGNLFMFIIAGHETTATSIHFCLLFLAMNPQVQRRAQEELDSIFGGRRVEQWDYERDLTPLLNGYLGAIMNEELRLVTPVITIPKQVAPTPQQLTVNGQTVTAPAGMMIKLCVAPVHRNPKYWPHEKPTDPNKPYFPPATLDNDLEEFKPERWLKPSQDQASSSGLIEPVKGAYIPFSDGARSCLGRRFAQVEILVALAIILRQTTVELAVDEWVTDEEVDKMDDGERATVWRKAEEKARWTWQNKMSIVITLQLRGAHIPFRFVDRGAERFKI